MISCVQNTTNGNYVLGARFNKNTYNRMVPLMSAAGYENVSTFVRDALLTKCKDIATELTDELDGTINQQQTR